MDITTTYLGMTLKNPVVASASPLTRTLDGIKSLAEAGVGAVVMHSLFEEQLTLESLRLNHYLDYFTDSFSESLSYFPEMDSYNIGPDDYLDLIRRARAAVDVPLIASLNGVTTGGWIDYARKMQEAGADALDLNIYYIPTDPALAAADVEQTYINIVSEVKKHISIPLAVKIGPYFSSMGNMAIKLADAGANALVLFNRFYQPDIDLEKLEVEPHLVLSTNFEMRLPMRWVAILHGRISADLAITSGVHDYQDVIKGLMVGANVVMMTSEILRNGTSRVTEVLQEMVNWMDEKEYESVRQMQGSMSQRHVAQPAVFERANYMRVLQSWRNDPAGQGLGLPRR
ncbi:MAG: dihydroorotate dehydrogenase-like protein [Anaerolineae bacterium]|nr:dihydroorotate dehydrogenase-like protein [Anaerolineae bacterium]